MNILLVFHSSSSTLHNYIVALCNWDEKYMLWYVLELDIAVFSGKKSEDKKGNNYKDNNINEKSKPKLSSNQVSDFSESLVLL